MASTSALLRPLPLRRPSTASGRPPPLLRRRSLSLILISPPAISVLSSNSPSRAENIPLFGLRKTLKKVEEAAEEIVREGEEVVGKEIVATEQGIQAAEEGIAAEAGGIALGFGGAAADLVQAGAVVGAEAVGVLVAASVVNGILGPEGKKL